MSPTFLLIGALVLALILLSARDHLRQNKQKLTSFNLLKDVDDRAAKRSDAEIKLLRQRVEDAERKRLEDEAKYRNSASDPNPAPKS